MFVALFIRVLIFLGVRLFYSFYSVKIRHSSRNSLLYKKYTHEKVPFKNFAINSVPRKNYAKSTKNIQQLILKKWAKKLKQRFITRQIQIKTITNFTMRAKKAIKEFIQKLIRVIRKSFKKYCCNQSDFSLGKKLL